MKSVSILIVSMFCFSSINAQNAANKLNKAAVKLDSNTNAINNTSNAVSNTGAAVSNMEKTIGDIFKSKKKQKPQTETKSPRQAIWLWPMLQIQY